MPPIPIHSDKPINPTAAKAKPLSPQTAGDISSQNPLSPETTSAGFSNVSTASGTAAKPGQPAMPVPTASINTDTPLLRRPQPTATEPLPENFGPPPPQPGPVPVPIAASSTTTTAIPGPPPASAQPILQPQPPATTAPARLPPQFSIPAPVDSSIYRPTHSTHPSTTPNSAGHTLPPTTLASGTTSASFMTSPQAVFAPHELAPEPAPSLDHPPGYIQNPFADTMTAAQRAEQRIQENAERPGMDVKPLSGVLGSGEGSGTGMTGNDAWDAAKKWVGGVAGKAAEIEQEVWKKINGQE